jgi:hypothetical protein
MSAAPTADLGVRAASEERVSQKRKVCHKGTYIEEERKLMGTLLEQMAVLEARGRRDMEDAVEAGRESVRRVEGEWRDKVRGMVTTWFLLVFSVELHVGLG